MTTTTVYNTLTKEWALDIICERLEKKWPNFDIAKEREVLAKTSRAMLLHSVGAQWYGDLGDIDEGLMAYAFGEMNASEQRSICADGHLTRCVACGRMVPRHLVDAVTPRGPYCMSCSDTL
jgi:hypothetical protein